MLDRPPNTRRKSLSAVFSPLLQQGKRRANQFYPNRFSTIAHPANAEPGQVQKMDERRPGQF